MFCISTLLSSAFMLLLSASVCWCSLVTVYIKSCNRRIHKRSLAICYSLAASSSSSMYIRSCSFSTSSLARAVAAGEAASAADYSSTTSTSAEGSSWLFSRLVSKPTWLWVLAN